MEAAVVHFWNQSLLSSDDRTSNPNVRELSVKGYDCIVFYYRGREHFPLLP